MRGRTFVDLLVVFLGVMAIILLAIILIQQPNLIMQYFEVPSPAPFGPPNLGLETTTTIQPTVAPTARQTPTPTPQIGPFVVTPTACSPNNSCLPLKPTYCQDGLVVNNCGQCGCPDNHVCMLEGCVPASVLQ